MTDHFSHTSPNTDATDSAWFDAVTQPYQYELLVHCYRILGSVEDAEDSLQVTLLRAWNRLEQLNDSKALRAWLYKIATNVSLDMLKSRKVRSLPHLTHPPADPSDPLPEPALDSIWLDPLPDFYVAQYGHDPENQHETREDISLAFLVVLQQLPGKQRAILLLRDVLEWRAKEVAAALEMSVAAVNSALQRARATLKAHQASGQSEKLPPTDDPEIAALLEQYVEAWQTADLPRLMTLIHEDARLTMPPLPVWYHGREAIRLALERFAFAGVQTGDFKLEATRANGKPAFSVYQRDTSGAYSLAAIHILTIQDGTIHHLDDYLQIDEALFSRFR